MNDSAVKPDAIYSAQDMAEQLRILADKYCGIQRTNVRTELNKMAAKLSDTNRLFFW